MTEKQKTSEIGRIGQQLAALREQVNIANADTKVHFEKRDQLNKKFKTLRQEIRELKKKRDNLNEKVKVLSSNVTRHAPKSERA